MLQSLLEKDPDKRLGSRDGFLEVKSHAYFKDIDWSNLKRVPVIIPSFTATNFKQVETVTRQSSFLETTMLDQASATVHSLAAKIIS